MFRPERMTRLNLLILEREEEAVLRGLGELGAVQLIRAQTAVATASLPPGDKALELERWVRLLARVQELQRSLGITASAKTPVKPAAISLAQAEASVERMTARAGELLKNREELLGQWTRLITDCELVSSYCGLDFPLGHADQSSYLHFVTGSLPAQNFERLQSQVAEDVALLPLGRSGERQPLIALTTRPGRAALDMALQQSGFQQECLPALEGATADSWCENNRRRREELGAALAQLNTQLQAVAHEYAQLLTEIAEFARVERCLLEAGANFARTDATVLISGWVPLADAPVLEARLRQITANRCAIQLSGPDQVRKEQAPVLLRNPRFLRPFQRLVAAYGLPQYQELEPTLFFAISYVLMFGMMFGDAGQGTVLAMAGLISFLASGNEKVRDAGLLLLFGGSSSLVFGLLYGSYFGLMSLKKYALWKDPLEGDPMQLIGVGLGLGVIVISLGLVLNIINRFRRGDVIGGFFDKFGVLGMLFYWGVLLLMTKWAELKSAGLVPLALIVSLLLPIVGWAIKEPVEYLMRQRATERGQPVRGLLAAMTESLVGAMEAVISYLANTISFVRLAAYAMSHGALLVAAFMLADAVRHLPIGGGLSLLVIILGNIGVLILEAVIASVQALRLEYYEFFGKFFSGAGQGFKPFRLVLDEQVAT